MRNASQGIHAPSVTLFVSAMKRSGWNILVCVLGNAVLVSCGYPGAPIPPALELAKPVTDLRAARKGDRVYLAWTVPAKTTDRQTVRHPGVTRICRSLEVLVADCQNPAAEIPAAPVSLAEQQFNPQRCTACKSSSQLHRCPLVGAGKEIPPPRSRMRYRSRTKVDAAPDSPTRCRSHPPRPCRRQITSVPRSKKMACCFRGSVHQS